MNHKCIQIIFLVFLLSTLTACNGQPQADLVEAVHVAGEAAEIDAAGEAADDYADQNTTVDKLMPQDDIRNPHILIAYRMSEDGLYQIRR